MGILDSLGVTEEQINNATGSAVAKEFEALKSGAFNATVKEVVVYKQKFKDNEATFMRYTVNITDNDKDLTFRNDIGKTLKDGKPNGGYADRLKMFSYATGVSMDELSMKDGAEVKSYGKDCSGSFIIGMNGKKLKALVRLTEDTNKADGEPYKFTNDIEGVTSLDGTDPTGENAVQKFEDKVAKTPSFKIKGYVKAGAKAATAGSTPASTADTTADF